MLAVLKPHPHAQIVSEQLCTRHLFDELFCERIIARPITRPRDTGFVQTIVDLASSESGPRRDTFCREPESAHKSDAEIYFVMEQINARRLCLPRIEFSARIRHKIVGAHRTLQPCCCCIQSAAETAIKLHPQFGQKFGALNVPRESAPVRAPFFSSARFALYLR
jgi:hypothetical protein